MKKNEKEPSKIKGYPGLKQLIPFYKKYLPLFILTVTLMGVSALFGFLSPIFSANALSTLTEGRFKLSMIFLTLYLFVRIIVSSLNFLYNRSYAKMDTKVVYDIKNTLIGAITNVEMSKNDSVNNGLYIERLHEDSRKCSDVLIDIMTISLEVISNLMFLIYIAFINIWFFVLLVVYVAILWFVDNKKEYRWYKDTRAFRDMREIATGSYNEQIRGLKDIKSLNIRDQTIKDSGEKYQISLNLRRKARITRHKFNLTRNILAATFDVALILLGIIFIKNSYISLANFLIVYMYRGNVRNLSTHFASIKQYAIEGEIAAQRIFEIINEFPKEKFGNETLTDVVGNVEFKNVTFAYETNKNVLKNLNCSFEANKTTAIVGKSGSGKSTILSLINKLYTIKKGQILLDGVDINTLTEDSLRNAVGVVTQSPYIFNCTIRENLYFIRPNITEDEMIVALKRAQIYDFVAKLENGLDSKVGENGVMLSGGQKQRLAIARVLLKNSPIIVLDEATSALDNKSQAKIVKAIDGLKKDHTIIIVAHRLSTIVNADKILVLDDGKIVDSGTHQQLFNTSPIYTDLYQSEEMSDLANSLKS